jgi:Amidohydrolase family
MIVKQSAFAVVQSSAAKTPELPDSIGGCPMTHTPTATLRLAVAWQHSPRRHGGRNLRGSKTTAISPLAVMVVVLLAAAGAGGTLLAGSDPTGDGGTLAGYGDQREIELLVKAGFTPEQAIHISTANGAEFLGQGSRIGTIAVGKQADLVVLRGDPSRQISDIRSVELVFRKGIGYSSAKLLGAVRGLAGVE